MRRKEAPKSSTVTDAERAEIRELWTYLDSQPVTPTDIDGECAVCVPGCGKGSPFTFRCQRILRLHDIVGELAKRGIDVGGAAHALYGLEDPAPHIEELTTEGKR